jgi:hypothetical protein
LSTPVSIMLRDISHLTVMHSPNYDRLPVIEQD